MTPEIMRAWLRLTFIGLTSTNRWLCLWIDSLALLGEQSLAKPKKLK